MRDGVLQLDRSLWRTARGERCDLAVCRGACCVNGIWVDLAQVQRILDAADAVRAHMAAPYAAAEDRWFGPDVMDHGDFPSGVGLATTVAPRADGSGRQGCIFVRADHKCALQLASLDLALPAPGLKPFDCATYPLLRSDGMVLVDDAGAVHHPGADCQQGGATDRPMRDVFAAELALAVAVKVANPPQK